MHSHSNRHFFLPSVPRLRKLQQIHQVFFDFNPQPSQPQRQHNLLDTLECAIKTTIISHSSAPPMPSTTCATTFPNSKLTWCPSPLPLAFSAKLANVPFRDQHNQPRQLLQMLQIFEILRALLTCRFPLPPLSSMSRRKAILSTPLLKKGGTPSVCVICVSLALCACAFA